jgi:hypothetical protein
VTPVVIEGWQYALTCADCGVETAGTYPAGLEPRRTFGPRIEALLSYLHERHHVGYERLVEVCRDVFGRAIRLHHERGQVTAETFARRRLLIENATDRLVFDPYVAPKTEAARLQKRYRLHRDSLYVFLDRAACPE